MRPTHMSLSPGFTLALLDSLSGVEIMVVMVVALVVLGPEKLPQIARQMGQWAAKLRALTQTLQNEMKDVLDDPAMAPLKDLSEFAAQPRKKLAELAMAAEEEARFETEVLAEDAPPAATEPVVESHATPDAEAEVEPEPEPDVEREPDVEVEPELEPEAAEPAESAEPAPVIHPDSPEVRVPAPITAKWRSS